MASGTTENFINMGTKMLQEERTKDGITLMRVLSLIGGIGVLTASVVSSCQVIQLLNNPGNYLLNVALGVLSISVIIMEIGTSPKLSRHRERLQEWAKVLTLPFGKSVFYLYIGVMSLALSDMTSLYTAVGLYMVLIGILHLMIALRNRSTQQTNQNLPRSAFGENPDVTSFENVSTPHDLEYQT